MDFLQSRLIILIPENKIHIPLKQHVVLSIPKKKILGYYYFHPPPFRKSTRYAANTTIKQLIHGGHISEKPYVHKGSRVQRKHYTATQHKIKTKYR